MIFLVLACRIIGAGDALAASPAPADLQSLNRHPATLKLVLDALSRPGLFHERKTLIFHDGTSFVNGRGKSLADVLRSLRQRPGLSGLSETDLRAAYLTLNESPVGRIGSPEQSALSALVRLDLIADVEWARLQSLARLHKKAEAIAYKPLHQRIWTLTDWPDFEQLSALDREIAFLLSHLNLLKTEAHSERAQRFRLIYGVHLVKSSGLSFRNPAAFNQYVMERTRLSFSPIPLHAFARLVRQAVSAPDVQVRFYEGRGGKDQRSKTTSNYQHMMDILNGNDQHSYIQQTAFRQRYAGVSSRYNQSLIPYLTQLARDALRREGVEELHLHDILDHQGRLLAVPVDMDDLPRFYQLYGGTGWNGAGLVPYAGNVQVQTRWGRKLQQLMAYYRAKTDAELVQAARKAEWEQLGVDVLHNIPFVGHVFGLTEAALSGQRLGILINSLGLAGDYAGVLVPGLLELSAGETAAAGSVRSAEEAVEERIAATLLPRHRQMNPVPDEFTGLAVGEQRTWTHPLTREYLTVTRLIDKKVLALRSRAGGRYVPVNFSSGKPDFTRVVFRDQHGNFYRGGLRGGQGGELPSPALPVKARVDVSGRFVVSKIGDEHYLDYEPTRNHYLRANVDEVGDLHFSVRADPETPQLGSGRDMFIGLMKRMKKKGIKLNRIVALWDSGSLAGESVNYQRFMASQQAGMTSHEAAFTTWTGKRAREYGFDLIEDIEHDPRYVTVSFARSRPAPSAASGGCCVIQ